MISDNYELTPARKLLVSSTWKIAADAFGE